MNFNYIDGEPLIAPSDRIKTDGEPVNWPLRQKCEKMETAELAQMVREANRVLTERKNARANKLIEKVCTALNELKEMGNVSFTFDCDEAYIHDILDEVAFFDKNMFKIRGN